MIKNLLKIIFLFPNNELARQKWVKTNLALINNELKILDAGCGTQQYKKYCKHLKYYAQDFAKYDGKGDGKGLQKNKWEYGKLDYIGDIWDIDEKDCFFDAILCTEVLEHVMYPNETIKEFSRLIKKDGILLITAPVNSVPHFSPYYYYNGFSENYYFEMAKQNNFEILSIEANGNAFEYIGGEIFRSIAYVKIPYRIIYGLFSAIFLIGLKFLSVKDTTTNQYLHSGYHVAMRKK